MPQDDDLVTTSELAMRYHVDASTIRRWAAERIIPVARRTAGGHARYDETAVDEAVDRYLAQEDQ